MDRTALFIARVVGTAIRPRKQKPSFRIYGYVGFVRHPKLKILEKRTFRKQDPFPSSGEGRETHSLLNPLERANRSWISD
jgi:hypothetical protein